MLLCLARTNVNGGLLQPLAPDLGKALEGQGRELLTSLSAPCRTTGPWLWRPKNPAPEEYDAALQPSTPRLAVGKMAALMAGALAGSPGCPAELPLSVLSKQWGPSGLD